MELLIDKKYLLRLERYTKFGYGGYYDSCAVRYVFMLPKSAGVPEGYTVYIDAEKVVWGRKTPDDRYEEPLMTKELERDKTYRLNREDSEYIATMTENRIEGKRYKRYKYSAEELYALYQNVDLSSAELFVAKVDIYLEGREGAAHKAFYGNRIDKTKYLVGKVKGCWFYCSELNTKRLISSHGVTILGKIKFDDELAVNKLISEFEQNTGNCKDKFLRIYNTQCWVERVINDVKYYCDTECRAPKDEEVLAEVRSVQRSAQNAMQFIERKISEENTELTKIAFEFENQLQKFYIGEKQ